MGAGYNERIIIIITIMVIDINSTAMTTPGESDPRYPNPSSCNAWKIPFSLPEMEQ